MKIGVISDIHIDINKAYPVTEILAEKVQAHHLDVLLIAGDISNHYATTLGFLTRFGELAGTAVYFVPGNHDMWDQSGECGDSWDIYRRYAEHPACLIDRCVPLDDRWVVTGDIGWYDYSFGSGRFSRDAYEKHSMYGRTWQDSIHVRWHRRDWQVHEDMIARLEKRLTDSRGKKRIVMTHMVGIDAFTVPESREKWDYFNAFLGSRQYGELYRKYGIEYGIMGHVHFRKHCTEDGVRYLCSCLCYSTEWQTGDCEREIEDALTVFSLDGGVT